MSNLTYNQRNANQNVLHFLKLIQLAKMKKKDNTNVGEGLCKQTLSCLFRVGI